MRKYFTCVQLFVATGLLASCLQDPTPSTPKMPEIKFDPKIEQMLETIRNEYAICDKKDSEQPQVSNEVLVNKIALEDQIDSQKTEYVECNGKVTSLGVKPVRKHSSLVKIEAPAEGTLAAEVNFISVENHRTCTTKRVKAYSDDKFGNKSKLAIDWGGVAFSEASFRGDLILSVEEAAFKMGLSLPILEGNNVLTVRYFGKCLVYNDKVDDKLTDTANCKTAEELGSKEVYLELHVNRPLIDGVRSIQQTCADKK